MKAGFFIFGGVIFLLYLAAQRKCGTMPAAAPAAPATMTPSTPAPASTLDQFFTTHALGTTSTRRYSCDDETAWSGV